MMNSPATPVRPPSLASERPDNGISPHPSTLELLRMASFVLLTGGGPARRYLPTPEYPHCPHHSSCAAPASAAF
eukprot:scaffold34132_cov17-Tisochrysis_lutea.AAC.2